MKKAVLFDLDGTVLDSQKGIYRSIAYALDKLSLSMPPEEELIDFLGPPLTMGFASVCHVPQHQIEDAVRLYREYYNAGGMFEAAIYNGVQDTLRALAQNGIRCYITTSKPQVYAQQILAHFGVDVLFDDIYGSELDGSRVNKAEVLRYCLEKQQLTPDDVVLVGDRCYDAQGAKALGMSCIGVTYGYGSSTELKEAGASAIIDTPAEIMPYVL